MIQKFPVRHIALVLALSAAVVLAWPARDASASDEAATGDTSVLKRHYEFTWGTWPNTSSLATDYLNINSLLSDGVSYSIKGSKIDHIAARLVNFMIVQGGIGCYLMGTTEHELGHVGYAFDAGFKPRLANFNIQMIRREFYARTPGDGPVMYLAGGMNTDTLTSYEAEKALYSGSDVPCYYGIIITYKKVSNFQYVYSKARYMERPLGNIRKFFKDYDPLIYDVYLAMKYGYYDSVVPAWAYAPFYKKPLYVPPNPYAYINPFLRDQYRRMKTAYLVELLDPAVINLVYGWMRYLGRGDMTFRPLMIPAEPVQLMPGMRASLGNFGAENYYDLHVAVDGMFQFSVYYRRGGNKWDTVHGCGIDVRNARIAEWLSIGAQFDYWTLVREHAVQRNRDYLLYNNLQPIAGLGYFRKNRGNRDCFNAMLKIDVRFYKDWFFTGSVGYKTYGALLGKQLEKGVYGSGGIGFNINYNI